MRLGAILGQLLRCCNGCSDERFPDEETDSESIMPFQAINEVMA